jgi:hypothetical protein
MGSGILNPLGNIKVHRCSAAGVFSGGIGMPIIDC